MEQVGHPGANGSARAQGVVWTDLGPWFPEVHQSLRQGPANPCVLELRWLHVLLPWATKERVSNCPQLWTQALVQPAS